MITWRAENYARVLYSMGINEKTILSTKQILTECEELVEALDNPAIKKKEKEAIIEAVFDHEMNNFIKVLCENNCIGMSDMIFKAYETIALEHKNIIQAKLSYVVRPDDIQLDQIKMMLCDKYKKTGVKLELQEDESLIGGYVLTVGDMEYDKSIKGTLSELKKTLVGR